MANIRAIRNRIKSIESTRQITRTMRRVAAAKLTKTQRSFGALQDFASASRGMLERLGGAGAADEPLLRAPETDAKLVYVLIVGNRGLCGTYNSALLKALQELAEAERELAGDADKEISLVVCGRWGREQIAALGLPVLRRFAVSDVPTAAEAEEISAYLQELYLGGAADRIVVVHQNFRSVLSQIPTARALLPLELPEGGAAADVIYEPDPASLLHTLLEQTLLGGVHAALLEARAAEHAARMTAMAAASDNTDELIAELSLKLNHARQAAITTEIAEISGGAAALKDKR